MVQDTGLYSYKIYGELKDIEPEICARVYMDLDYRKVWDSYVKGKLLSFSELFWSRLVLEIIF